MDRRAGHPVRALHRHRVLRVRQRRRHRRIHPACLPVRAAVGASRACVRWSAWTPGAVRPSRPTAGSTPTPRCASNSRSKTRGTRRRPNPGHAAVRYTNPTTGGDVMPTIRAEFHRLRAGAAHQGPPRRRVPRLPGLRGRRPASGSASAATPVSRGDLFVVPSWVPWSLQADTEFDLFLFSDAPIVERLHFHRTLTSKGA